MSADQDDDFNAEERAIMRAYLAIPEVHHYYINQGVYPCDWDEVIGSGGMDDPAPVSDRWARRLIKRSLLKMRVTADDLLMDFVNIKNITDDEV